MKGRPYEPMSANLWKILWRVGSAAMCVTFTRKIVQPFGGARRECIGPKRRDRLWIRKRSGRRFGSHDSEAIAGTTGKANRDPKLCP